MKLKQWTFILFTDAIKQSHFAKESELIGHHHIISGASLHLLSTTLQKDVVNLSEIDQNVKEKCVDLCNKKEDIKEVM